MCQNSVISIQSILPVWNESSILTFPYLCGLYWATKKHVFYYISGNEPLGQRAGQGPIKGWETNQYMTVVCKKTNINIIIKEKLSHKDTFGFFVGSLWSLSFFITSIIKPVNGKLWRKQQTHASLRRKLNLSCGVSKHTWNVCVCVCTVWPPEGLTLRIVLSNLVTKVLLRVWWTL